MKRIVLLLLLGMPVFLLAGCKKDQGEKNVRNSLVGQWELRHARAQFTADYTSGNGNLLKFTTNTYERFRNGQLEKAGIYKISSEESPKDFACLVQPRGAYKYRIIYDNDDSTWTTYLRVSGDNLQLITGCFANDSGAIHDYEKQSSQ